jgi:hypothetical protein
MASAAVTRRLARLGQGVLSPAAGLAALARAMRAVGFARPRAAPVVTVNPFEWHTYSKAVLQVGLAGSIGAFLLQCHWRCPVAALQLVL